MGERTMRHTDPSAPGTTAPWLVILALVTSSACTTPPAPQETATAERPKAPVLPPPPVEEEPEPRPAECDPGAYFTAKAADGAADLAPFLPRMQAAFGDDMLVCASPTAGVNAQCEPLFEGLFGRAAIPNGFYIFDAEDFTLDVTVFVNVGATTSAAVTPCDPPRAEAATEAACETRVHDLADGVSASLEPVSHAHDELDRRMIHRQQDTHSVCQGLVLARMVPTAGVYENRTVYQHTLLSKRWSDARVDTIALSALMVDLDARSEVDDVLVYTADTMNLTIDELDPSTRAPKATPLVPDAPDPGSPEDTTEVGGP
jgi:hypothetical protein